MAVLLVATVAATGTNAQTVVPIDQEWGHASGDWRVYYSEAVGNACIAEARRIDGTLLLLGEIGDNGRLLFGIGGIGTSRMKSESLHELRLTFDGRDVGTVGASALAHPDGVVLLGSYVDAGELREQIAASSTMVAYEGADQVASASLEGTRRAFDEIEDCLLTAKSGFAAQASITDEELSLDVNWRDLDGWTVGWSNARRTCIATRSLADNTVLWVGYGEDPTGAFLTLSSPKLHGLEADVPIYVDLAGAGVDRRTLEFASVGQADGQQLISAALSAATLDDAFSRSQLTLTLMDGNSLASLSTSKAADVLLATTECTLAVDQGTALQAQLSTASMEKAHQFYDGLLDVGGIDEGQERLLRLAIAAQVFGLETADEDAAIKAQRNSLSLFEAALGQDHVEVAISLDNLAIALRGAGQVTESLRLFARACRIFEDKVGNGHPDARICQRNWAEALIEVADYASAYPVLAQLITHGSERNLDWIMYSMSVGAMQSLGREDLIATALAMLESSDHGFSKLVAPITKQALASVLHKEGRIAEAERHYLELIGGRAEDETAALVSMEMYLEVAHFYIDIDRDRDAEQFALRAFEALDASTTYESEYFLEKEAEIYNVLGHIRNIGGDTTGALAAYDDALSTLLVLGSLESQQENAAFRRAIVQDNMLLVLLAKQDYERAEAVTREVTETLGRIAGRTSRDFGLAMLRRGEALLGLGRLEEADSAYREAASILSDVEEEEGNLAAALRGLSEVRWRAGARLEALDFLRWSADLGYVSRDEHLRGLFGEDGGAVGTDTIDEALHVVQATADATAGSALTQFSARTSAGSGALADLVRKEQDLSLKLVALRDALISEVGKQPAERTPLLAEQIQQELIVTDGALSNARKSLEAEFPGYAEFVSYHPLTLADAQALLAPDELLIVIDIAKSTKGQDYVWAISRERAVWEQLETSNGEVAKSVSKLRGGLNDPAGPKRAKFDLQLAHALYKSLLGPIESELLGKSHLIFALHGAVSSLPPQLLVATPPTRTDFTKADWLINSHAVTVVPSIPSFGLLRSREPGIVAPKPLVAYGNPNFGKDCQIESAPNRTVEVGAYARFFSGSLADPNALSDALSCLPGTGVEVQAVAEALGATPADIAVGDAATETAVKVADLGEYRVVYFATHGLVAGETASFVGSAAEPALALTIPNVATAEDDGLLTASEVAQLKLNADWVVLSACNTADSSVVGADALAGLAKAFFYAGARSMLVTHWAVDDLASSELMIRTFEYQRLHPEVRGAEALRQAMLSIMRDSGKPEWSDPVYWAAYVLVGEPRSHTAPSQHHRTHPPQNTAHSSINARRLSRKSVRRYASSTASPDA